MKKTTVFLPKTKFLVHVKGSERAALDSQLTALGALHDFYAWQSSRPSSANLKNFTLLDGPPYANGPPHVGHAINKVLKDFTLKSRVLVDDCRVEYRPGWDCHGLPIELKIRKERKSTDPLEIRKEASALALVSIRRQMNAFKKWGVAADWDNYYCTMDGNYVANQLRRFADFYEKGLVYRAFKPVYWSPSSKTSLAESELEYNKDHKSLAVYFRYQLINFDLAKVGLTSTPNRPVHIFALVWTTTPWTLPLNNAIGFSPQVDYLAVEFCTLKQRKLIREVFLVARPLLEQLRAAFDGQLGELKVHGSVPADYLGGLFYRSPMFNELAQPFLAADFVGQDMGTGLVHVSYAHGFDDYKLALARGDKVECFVDGDGRYTRRLGYALEGKSIFDEGAESALKLLAKHVVYTHDHTHSYPYDWRTKQPVIIRSSEQWFIDLTDVGRRSTELLEENGIKVGSGDSDFSPAMNGLLRRTEWCISRQRVWGVPIPCLIDRATKNAETSGDFIRFVADLVARNGSADFWWRMSADELLSHSACPKNFLPSTSSTSDYEKGADIMDVWLDSGMAWQTLRDANTGEYDVADAILEGKDQLRGWFNSLLLTSVAANNKPPYKRVFVHGFAVDDERHKMSKSVGNVVSPDTVTDGKLNSAAIGVDGLRFWVALHSAETARDARIGPEVIRDIEARIVNIRKVYRFLLGTLDCWETVAPRVDAHLAAKGDGSGGESALNLSTLDRYILLKTRQFVLNCEEDYRENRFRTVIDQFSQFFHNPLSLRYIHYVRDRLYCARVGSPEHNAARFTIDRVGRALSAAVSPILPHLAVEYFAHHPLLRSRCEDAIRQPLSRVLEEVLPRELCVSRTGIYPADFEVDKRETLAQKEEEKLLKLMEECIFKIRAKVVELTSTVIDDDGSETSVDSTSSSTTASVDNNGTLRNGDDAPMMVKNDGKKNKGKKTRITDISKKGVVISASPAAFDLLAETYTADDPMCDLAELLGLSHVELRRTAGDAETSTQNEFDIHVEVVQAPLTRQYCTRCRRMTRRADEEKLCVRCTGAVPFSRETFEGETLAEKLGKNVVE